MTTREFRALRVSGTTSFPRAGTIPSRQPAARWLEHAWRLLALPLILLFFVPIATLFSRISLQALAANVFDAAVLNAIGVSLQTTAISLGLIVLLGPPWPT